MSRTYITARDLCRDALAMVGQFKYAQVDCIRVIVNPLKTRGKTFPIIGSNYFVRYEVYNLQRLTSESQLKPGRALFRSKDPIEVGYALPERYQKGGAYDTGDYRDYHHIGLYVGDGKIVDSNKSATQDGPAISTNWKAWEWVADIKAVEYPDPASPDTEAEGGEQIMKTATVNTGGRGPVNFRQGADGNAKFCFKNPSIPEGTVVEVLGTKGEWTQVRFNGETGWVKSVFLTEGGTSNQQPVKESQGDAPEGGSGYVSIPRKAAEEMLEYLTAALKK